MIGEFLMLECMVRHWHAMAWDATNDHFVVTSGRELGNLDNFIEIREPTFASE